jgi:hypothetical protein
MGGITLALALAPAWLGQPARADTANKAESALAQVPAEAPIVIHLHGLERTKDRLVTMIQNALPDLAPMVKAKLDEAMKEGLEGRQIKGLPKDGSIFVVFPEMPKPGEDVPHVAVIAAVSDYKAFRDGVLTEDERKSLKSDKAGYDQATIDGQDVFFVDRKGYVVVTPQKDVATQLTKKQAGLDSKLNKDLAAKLMAADVAVYVDMGAVNKEFGDQIKAFKPLLEFGLQQAGGQLDKNTLEMTKAMFNGFFQLLEDSRGFLLGAEFRPEGLAIHNQVLIANDTKIDALLKKAHRAAYPDLAKLPADQMGYFAMYFGPELYEAFQPFITGIFADGDAKEAKAVKDALNQIQQAGMEAVIGEFNLPPQGLSISQVKDPAKAVAGNLHLLQQFKEGGTYGSAVLKGKPEVKPNAETVRGFKLNYVHITYDFDKMAEKLPGGGKEATDAMKAMMGDGIKMWFGTDGKSYVQITAPSWDAAKRLFEEYLDGKNAIGKQKPFEESVKQLPTQATLMGLVDVPQYVAAMSKYMGPLLKGQGLPVEIPPLTATKGKTYAGMALTLRPEQGSVDIWVPGTTVSEVRKMVEPVLKGAGLQ